MNRYIIPLFIMFLTISVYVLYIDAGYQGIQHQLVREQELISYIKDAQTAQEKLTKISSDYSKFSPDADKRLNTLLPTTIDTIRLTVDINRVAEEHGMQASGLSISKGNDGDVKGVVPYAISFQVTTTYPLFKEFLDDLQHSLSLRDITSISFSAPQKTSSADLKDTIALEHPELNVLQYRVNLTTYSLH
jgi:hypothetical protein